MPNVKTEDEVLLVAVMGPTGAGKSSFINAASGSQFDVGHGLKSCTSKIVRTGVFALAGREIILIDTPGFDDTNISDIDVLKSMSGFLSATYEFGYKLSGVIYLHRISDVKVGGVSRRNLAMFRKLCGEEASRNVAFVTTMWDQFVGGDANTKPAVERERELASGSEFLKSMVEQGARMYRHDNTVESARSIVSAFVCSLSKGIPLRVQREIVDEGMSISATAAGKELLAEQEKLQRKHMEDLNTLEREMHGALTEGTKDHQHENSEVCHELRAKIRGLREECKWLEEEFAAKRRELWAKVAEARSTLESARGANADAEKKLRELRDRLQKKLEEREKVKEWVKEGVIVLVRLLDLAISIYNFAH